MPASQGPLHGGELNAAVTSALVGIHSQYLGRGPGSASTFYQDNVLVSLMYEVMTPAERTLASGPRADSVIQMRHHFQEAMQTDYTEAVERLTGKRVTAFISGNHLDPDIAAEVFILDSPIAADGSPAGQRGG
ncbi:MAG: Na-translocating system protein MpsC family protein [Thermoleophilia bacterium]